MVGNKGVVVIWLDFVNILICFVMVYFVVGFVNYDEWNRDYVIID